MKTHSNMDKHMDKLIHIWRLSNKYDIQWGFYGDMYIYTIIYTYIIINIYIHNQH